MSALGQIKVLDLSRLAPGPYCTMLLSDFGADVLVVEAVPGSSEKLRPIGDGGDGRRARAVAGNPLGRGKRSIALNLKDPAAREIFYELAKDADVVLEGFRPGVAKRLGVDYETLAAINPADNLLLHLWIRQTGPYANAVGHDINYISLGGVLGSTGAAGQPPVLPQLLIADFAGGGLTAAFAICAAIIAREHTGRGQAIDLGMSDGVLALMTSAASGYLATGQVTPRGSGLLSGEAPFYNVYETSDGRWFSLGAVEGHFYDELCEALAIPEMRGEQYNRERWPEFKERITTVMKTKTADEWEKLLVPRDIAAAPILELDKVVSHPHNLARGMIVDVETPYGPVRQVGVAAKLSDTPGAPKGPAPATGEHTESVLASLGYDAERIAALRASGVVG